MELGSFGEFKNLGLELNRTEVDLIFSENVQPFWIVAGIEGLKLAVKLASYERTPGELRHVL